MFKLAFLDLVVVVLDPRMTLSMIFHPTWAASHLMLHLICTV